MNTNEIGTYIAERRKDQKLTQEQLGEKLGVSYQAVSKWERGENFQTLQYYLTYQLF